jgi:hypothetical protein
MRKLKRYLALGVLLGGFGWGVQYAYQRPDTLVGQCVRKACEVGLHANPLYALGQGLADGASSRAAAEAAGSGDEMVDPDLSLDPTPVGEDLVPSGSVPMTIVIPDDPPLPMPHPVLANPDPGARVKEADDERWSGLPALPVPVPAGSIRLMPYCRTDEEPGQWMPYAQDTEETASRARTEEIVPAHAELKVVVPSSCPFLDLWNALFGGSCWKGCCEEKVQDQCVPEPPAPAPDFLRDGGGPSSYPDPHAGYCPYTGRCAPVRRETEEQPPPPGATEPPASEPSGKTSQLQRLWEALRLGTSPQPRQTGVDTMEFRRSDYKPTEHGPGPY